jgi:hypothetical protein
MRAEPTVIRPVLGSQEKRTSYILDAEPPDAVDRAGIRFCVG